MIPAVPCAKGGGSSREVGSSLSSDVHLIDPATNRKESNVPGNRHEVGEASSPSDGHLIDPAKTLEARSIPGAIRIREEK